MKKFLLGLIFILLFPLPIKAETYYSSYTEFDDYTDVYTPSNDLTNCEVRRHYRWYTNEIIGDYFLFNQNPSDYNMMDGSCLIPDYSPWQRQYPPAVEYRHIETRNVYEVKKIQPVRYLHFTGLFGNYDYFRISELQVFYQNQRINYNYYCEGCNSEFGDYINNDRINENKSYITNGGYLRIDLGHNYDAKDIIIKMSLYDVGPINMNYRIYYTQDINGQVFFNKSFNHLVVTESLQNIYLDEKGLNNFEIVNPQWDFYTSLTPVAADMTTIVDIFKEYRYQDMLFFYYKYERSYLAGYHVHREFYVKDEQLYKDYYRCQKRDKVTIADNIVITDLKTKLNDFIYDNTTDYQIIADIDYTKNGDYPIAIVLPFMTIKTNVQVNILNNELNPLYSSFNAIKEELINIDNRINNKQVILEEILAYTRLKEYLMARAALIKAELKNLTEESYKYANNQELAAKLLAQKQVLEELALIIESLEVLNKDVNKFKEQNHPTFIEIIDLENSIMTIEERFTNNLEDYQKLVIDNQANMPNNLENNKLIKDIDSVAAEINIMLSALKQRLLDSKTNVNDLNNFSTDFIKLKEVIITNYNAQSEKYHQQFQALNNKIINQNQVLKDVIKSKKELTDIYENNDLALNILLKEKEAELNLLKKNDIHKISNKKKFGSNKLKIDYLMIIIICLFAVMVVFIKYIYKKNVELK